MCFLDMILLSAETPFFIGLSWTSAICLIIFIMLLLLSAIASGSETAFFSLLPNDINEMENSDNRAEKLVLELRNKPKQFLATILIFNNLVNVTITIFSTYIMSLMFNLEVNPLWAFIINVIIVTSLLLIFGEMIPKITAAKSARSLATNIAPMIKFLMFFFKPLSSILVHSTSIIDKRLAKKNVNTLSITDLSTAVDLTTADETPADERSMLQGIATFGEKEVSDIMQPRVQLFAVKLSTQFDNLIEMVIQNGFSRIPVYEDTLDDIKGILYVKDLLPFLDTPDFHWQRLIRQAFFVPENKKINDLFQDFRSKKIHIAIVVDEYGGTSGLVTMEDVLEEIVGDIRDEFDAANDNKFYHKIDDNTYIFQGQTSLVDFCKVFDINELYFEEIKGESDTLAGLILEMEGRIPVAGYSTSYKEFGFVIEKADKRRIIEIKVTYNENK
ncbi:MAG: gliding motility-associated protein GldE [Bacteroidales bacterium]|nr:gliding motility-associated protein GldE [Bacteroidales bacterium]